MNKPQYLTKSLIAIAALTLVMLTGCTPKTPEAQAPLEVNDENCTHEKIKDVTPTAERERFASLCLRRSSFKPSKAKEW